VKTASIYFRFEVEQKIRKGNEANRKIQQRNPAKRKIQKRNKVEKTSKQKEKSAKEKKRKHYAVLLLRSEKKNWKRIKLKEAKKLRDIFA
jgi:hypothetical protein